MNEPTQEEINELLKAPPPIQEPTQEEMEEVDRELDELSEKYPLSPLDTPDLTDFLYMCDLSVERGWVKNFDMRISYGKLEMYDENGKLDNVYERKGLDFTPIGQKN